MDNFEQFLQQRKINNKDLQENKRMAPPIPADSIYTPQETLNMKAVSPRLLSDPALETGEAPPVGKRCEGFREHYHDPVGPVLPRGLLRPLRVEQRHDHHVHRGRQVHEELRRQAQQHYARALKATRQLLLGGYSESVERVQALPGLQGTKPKNLIAMSI